MSLLTVPNVSEGRDPDAIDAIAAAFAPAEVLDVSSDADHHRTVFTVRGERLAERVAAAAEVVLARVDLREHRGVHPRAGALDVAPIVYLQSMHRGEACAEALVLGELLGRLGIPVVLYGALAGGRTRAEIRRDPRAFAPDFGPREPHPTAGITLVAARPPLIAFNVEIDGTLDQARAIAAEVRELPGVVALGLELERAGTVQVSTNVEHPEATSPAQVVAAVARRARVTGAELVAPAPARWFADFPADVPLAGAERAFL